MYRAFLVFGLCGLMAAQENAQEDPAKAIADLMKDGNASFLKRDYEAARLAFAGAWEAAQKTPKDSPLRYDVLKKMVSVRAAQGEFADADNWLQQAITWRENTLGQRDPKIPDDLLISVSFCRGMKDYDRAMYILRRVQALHTAIYGAESTMVADDLHRLAQVYMEQKQSDPAIGSLNAALEIRTKLAGPLDPSLVPDLDRLGELYTTKRAYDDAVGAFRHVLVIRETLYGKVHADLISTVDGLAYGLFGLKNYEAAEPVYRRLLQLWETSVGPEHPMVAVALDKIAVFYAEQKKYDEAREALDRSTAIRARFYAMGLSQQATQAFTETQLEQAKGYYQRALAALDPPNAINDDLRAQLEGLIKTLEAPLPKPGPPPKKATAAKKAEATKK